MNLTSIFPCLRFDPYKLNMIQLNFDKYKHKKISLRHSKNAYTFKNAK